ncbi:MAG: hypothetical protein C0404_01325 [Verrucomicrobia bacterium]|nr:hypothetical protein [Verrucomicrobiota bacterium]
MITVVSAAAALLWAACHACMVFMAGDGRYAPLFLCIPYLLLSFFFLKPKRLPAVLGITAYPMIIGLILLRLVPVIPSMNVADSCQSDGLQRELIICALVLLVTLPGAIIRITAMIKEGSLDLRTVLLLGMFAPAVALASCYALAFASMHSLPALSTFLQQPSWYLLALALASIGCLAFFIGGLVFYWFSGPRRAWILLASPLLLWFWASYLQTEMPCPYHNLFDIHARLLGAGVATLNIAAGVAAWWLAGTAVRLNVHRAFAILLAVIVVAGCSWLYLQNRRMRDTGCGSEDVLWNRGCRGVSLPMVFNLRDRTTSADRDARTISIRISAAGDAFIGETQTSTNTLLAIAARTVSVYGANPPVVIAADKECEFKSIFPVMKTLSRVGIWKQSFLVMTAGDRVHVEDIPFFVPGRDGGQGTVTSPVSIKGFTGNTPPEGVWLVEIAPDGIRFNQQTVSIAAFEESLQKEPRGRKDNTILLMPHPGVRHKEVVMVMDVLTKQDFRHISFVERQDGSP